MQPSGVSSRGYDSRAAMASLGVWCVRYSLQAPPLLLQPEVLSGQRSAVGAASWGEPCSGFWKHSGKGLHGGCVGRRDMDLGAPGDTLVLRWALRAGVGGEGMFL